MNYNYEFTAKELDNETSYNYFGARYYDSDVSVWLSVDPMSDKRSWLSPYNYCQLNPVKNIDSNGKIDSPIFDTKGNFLGTDSDGYKGKILIFDNPSKFEKGMSHKKASLIGKEYSPNLLLSKDAKNKIFSHAMSGLEFPDGKVLKSSEFTAYVKSMPFANAEYEGFINNKHKVALDIGECEWTVENIRGVPVHEIWGHGIKKWGDNSKTHHLCYFAEIDSKYWQGSTERYKISTLESMWEYYYREIGFKPLPTKYHNEYNKYIKHE